jgi:putative phosphoesterase
MVMRVVVLADTHVRAGSIGRLPEAAHSHLERADVILHAGDVLTQEFLDWLASFAAVHAVLGNNDHSLVGRLPETIELILEGVRIGMVHDSGPRAGRADRLRRYFPDADVVVFGHSHEPCCEAGVDGQLLFNPGSPTQRRRAPQHTLGELDLDASVIARAQIVPLR